MCKATLFVIFGVQSSYVYPRSIDMTLFERVKEISDKRGFSSLRVLSEDAGLSPNVVYGWKTKKPSSQSLEKVAKVLNVSTDYLLGNTDEMTPNIKDSTNELTEVNLNEALSDSGMAMFDGQPLSEEYKRALLAMLRTIRGEDEK